MAQFIRYAEISIDDRSPERKKRLLTTLNSDFRIEFEFNKTLDNTTDSECGWVKIYNLSRETVVGFGDRYSELTLRVGYIHEGTHNVKTLFVADITDIEFKKEGGTEVQLNLTSNFVHMFTGTKLSVTMEEGVPLSLLLDKICKTEPYTGWSLSMVGVDKEKQTTVKNFINNYKFQYGYSVFGTIKKSLDNITRSVGLTWRVGDDKKIVLSVKPELIRNAVNAYENNLIDAVNKTAATAPSATTPSTSTLTADSSTTTAPPAPIVAYTSDDSITLVLNEDTGLIGLPYLKSEEVSKSQDEALEANEHEVNGKKKYNDDGTVKESKKKKVRRYSVQLKALINPDIVPNSIIRIETASGITDGVYRVRNVKFNGDTHGDAWFMEIEASNNAEEKKIAPQNQVAQEVQIKAGKPPVDANKFNANMEHWYTVYGFSDAQKSLLKGQIQQESGFNPSVVSATGVRGLAQFTRPTGKAYNVSWDVTSSGIDSQIRGQAHYMRDLTNQFGGNIDMAFAAYNAGSGYVAAAVSQYGSNWLANIGNVSVSIKGIPTRMSTAKAREVQGYIPKIHSYGALYTPWTP